MRNMRKYADNVMNVMRENAHIFPKFGAKISTQFRDCKIFR
jgi:hypothetical protein